MLQFLQEISQEWEETLKENKQLRDKSQDQHEDIVKLLENEKSLKETMLTAQKMTEQLTVQAKKEAAHNKAIKSNLKTVVKKADAAISAGAADKDVAVKAAVVAIDKAAGKGVLHKNTASRKVARLAKAAHKASL